VRLEVYGVLGQLVGTLVDTEMPAGMHEAVLEAGSLPSGMYVIRFTSGRQTATRTAVLVR
jgi:hypothetical protein